jgi:hypothetical protein
MLISQFSGLGPGVAGSTRDVQLHYTSYRALCHRNYHYLHLHSEAHQAIFMPVPVISLISKTQDSLMSRTLSNDFGLLTPPCITNTQRRGIGWFGDISALFAVGANSHPLRGATESHVTWRGRVMTR